MAMRASSPSSGIPTGYHFEYVAEKLMLRFTRAIRRRMREEGITQTALANRLGVSQAYVSKALRYDQNMTLRTLAIIAEGLGAEWAEPMLCPKVGTAHEQTIVKTEPPVMDIPARPPINRPAADESCTKRNKANDSRKI